MTSKEHFTPNQHKNQSDSSENQLPHSPCLLEPVDGAQVFPLTRLAWEPIAESVRYHLQIATEAAFARPDLIESVAVPDDNWVAFLPEAATCYWRVSAITAAAVGPWSDSRTFSTVPVEIFTASTPPNPNPQELERQ